MRSLGIGIDLSLAGLRHRGGGSPAAFTPAQLFAGGSKGVWYDPSDLGSMSQDSAGTIPAVPGAPVGRLRDKSGNVYDAVQPDPAKRPVLIEDENGRLCLSGDGIGQWIAASFAIAQPWVRVSAIRQDAWVEGRRIFGSTSSSSGVLCQRTNQPNLALHIGSAPATTSGLPVGATGVVTERHHGAASRIAVGSGPYANGNASATQSNGIVLFAGAVGAQPGKARCYGVIQIERDLSDAEVAALRGFLAAKAGVTL